MNISEILHKTANHIERVGLNQNGSYYDQSIADREVKDCPACIIGALDIVCGDTADFNKTSQFLREQLGRPEYFSDNAVNQRAAIDKLRELAELDEAKV